MKTCYFAQLFLLDEEQLNKMFDEQTKEKDSQLEINFEKANAEAEQDEILNKMTKKELIERCKYLQKVNIEIDEKRKTYCIKFEKIKNEANEKINKLIVERNDLLNKLSKANNYIEYLKAIIESSYY